MVKNVGAGSLLIGNQAKPMSKGRRMMRVLVFAPHNDDEVLGVGGTIAKLADQGHDVFVCEVTVWKENPNGYQGIQNQAVRAHDILGVRDSFFLNLPVVGLKETPTYIKNTSFQKIVDEIKPQIAFIPHAGDMHVDHAETAAAAMVALRPIDNSQLKAIYAYETLSETEWNTPDTAHAFIPNAWSDITDTFTRKIEAMKCFTTQLRAFPHPRSLEAMEALARLRGSTVGVAYAEAFSLIRYVFR